MLSLLLISEDKFLLQGLCHLLPACQVLGTSDINRLYRLSCCSPVVIDTRVLLQITDPGELIGHLKKIQTMNIILMDFLSIGGCFPLQLTCHLNSRQKRSDLASQLRAWLCRKGVIDFWGLTPMEMAVIFLSFSGIPMSQAATKLDRSIKTLYTHRVNAIKKLGYNNFNAYSRVCLVKN
uniref:hypothetical protein n=1 Tax=Serratia proteamaculans TaxID=28151 RepID=UPI001F4C08CF|nr:hypothetical protein [Serratia proteamaculans]ULG17715.1 hypothetical protein F28p_00045 [Serratia proteamaculans]